MKKLILAAGLITSLTAMAAVTPHYLHYNYSETVKIIISNVECPIPQIKDEYKFAAAAIRIDGNSLKGCYKPVDDNIEIQWMGGDKSVFPANAFLMDREGNT